MKKRNELTEKNQLTLTDYENRYFISLSSIIKKYGANFTKRLVRNLMPENNKHSSENPLIFPNTLRKKIKLASNETSARERKKKLAQSDLMLIEYINQLKECGFEVFYKEENFFDEDTGGLVTREIYWILILKEYFPVRCIFG